MNCEELTLTTSLMRATIKCLDVEAPSSIRPGPLELPDGLSVDGGLIAFAEDDAYIHCVIGGTGTYYGIYRSSDADHVYQRILALNSQT